MTYNPDTGNYSVRDIAGNFIGDTAQREVAETWWRYASGSKSRGMHATPARCQAGAVPGTAFNPVPASVTARLLAGITLADVPAALCAGCGRAFGEACQPARVVTDWRFGDVMCSRCTAGYAWAPEDWQALNPGHYLRVPR
jgi:hypothetical protein